MSGHEGLGMLRTAQALADGGRHAALVAYLEEQPEETVRRSPTTALLFAIGHARIGQYAEARHWAVAALSRAREAADGAVEARAINVAGAIDLETGHMENAVQGFEHGLAVSSNLGATATVGCCANNLGIIAHLRGEYVDAIGWFTRALSAYARTGQRHGEIQTHHNLAMIHRDRSEYELAMDASREAVVGAERLGDRSLIALTRAGRAEILVQAGEPERALPEAEAALAIHRELEDPVGTADDLRIVALARAAGGAVDEAEAILLDVVRRADGMRRALLSAAARRDLALVLRDAGRAAEALFWAGQARARFRAMGATAESSGLGALLEAA